MSKTAGVDMRAAALRAARRWWWMGTRVWGYREKICSRGWVQSVIENVIDYWLVVHDGLNLLIIYKYLWSIIKAIISIQLDSLKVLLSRIQHDASTREKCAPPFPNRLAAPHVYQHSLHSNKRCIEIPACSHHQLKYGKNFTPRGRPQWQTCRCWRRARADSTGRYLSVPLKRRLQALRPSVKEAGVGWES